MLRLNLSKLLPLLVLASGLAVTFFLQQIAFNDARKNQRYTFNHLSLQAILHVQERLADYEQVLRGARGLFIASRDVEREEFRDYVDTLQLVKRFPGTQGVGFSQIVPLREKASHIEAIRKEGFKNYTINPKGQRSLYAPVILLEPFTDRNLRAFGYDMYSEATRRTAMEQARDSNEPVISGKVKLELETDQGVQAGFLMYLPVYRKGSSYETLAERRKNIIGWVYSPFRMNNLMRGILGDQVNNIDLEIYDGEDVAAESLMYDSNSTQKHTGTRLFNFSQDLEVAGHNWHIRLHSLPFLEKNIDGGRATVIWQAGTLMSILLSLLVWQLASGRLRAIKLAQKMTNELRESEATSRTILEAIPVPLALNAEHGNITYLNRAFMQTTGYTLDDIPTLTDWWSCAFPDPQYRQWVTENWQKNMSTAKRTYAPFSSFEMTIKCKDGSDRTFLAGATSIKENFVGTHMVILYDITDRKRAEEHLRTLSIAIEQSPLSVIITDLNAIIRYANPCFLSTTGYSMDEVIGQSTRILRSGLTPKETFEELWKTLADGQVWRGEIINKRKNGEYYWEEVHIAPVTDTAGIPILYVAVKLEITQRKEYEKELKRSNSELEQFSYAISHDMRQPLRMISSYLQLIEMNMAGMLDGENLSYFNFAIEGAKRIDQMLIELLEYSRVGRKGEPATWVSSRDILDEALQFLQPAMTEAQAMLEISGEWPSIFASRDEIERLLQNLLGNAIKFTIAGQKPEITISSKVVRNEWRLCVADNGVGIIPDQAKRLFQIFQRLQSRDDYEGTGIGLALCRRIAEHHKGHIWVESAGIGRGSKFCVRLPVLHEKQYGQSGIYPSFSQNLHYREPNEHSD